MRKISLLALIFILILASATGQEKTITVSAPRAGDTLCKGRTHQILWTSSGIGDRVMIQLISSGGVVVSSTETENDGLYKYTVPSTTSDGNYTVAISTLDGRVRGVSGSFRIDSCLSALPASVEIAPSITVDRVGRSRNAGETLWHEYINGMFPVKWRTTGRVPATVAISLHPVGCSGTGIRLSGASTNAHIQWVRIPLTTPEGDYAIRVGQFGSSLYGCSEPFHLRIDLVVTEPTRSTIWHPGERVVVRWRRYRPTALGRIYILYSKEDDIGRGVGYTGSLTLHDVADSLGEFPVTLPADLAPGRYAICLSDVTTTWGAGACSEFFQVVAR